MTTAKIAHHLAHAAARFPGLGPVCADDLLALVRAELGHEDALERFHPYGGHGGSPESGRLIGSPESGRRTSGRMARAVGPGRIVHVISGNTPQAGLQSLVRGLLVGAWNGCKLPRRGLPELGQFREALPPELARRVEFATELRDDWLAQADAVVVFGRDETVESVRRRVRAGQRFIAHAHRLSFGVVFGDPAGHSTNAAAFESVPAAARSASLYNQQGCLSPHLFYVHAPIAREYARRLAAAMAEYEKTDPRGEISLPEQAAIAAVRREFAFRTAMAGGAHEADASDQDASKQSAPARDLSTIPALWESPGNTAWTVIYDPEPAFTASCLNRVIYVKPLPESRNSHPDALADAPANALAEALAEAVRPVRRHLSCAGIHPATPENAARVALTGVPRICPIAQMQFPPWTWHHDGQPVLLPLVSWVDFEPQ